MSNLNNMVKRIGIDARFYGPFGKGLGRYVQKLVENLEDIENESPESDREYFVFLRKDNFDAYQPKSEKFHKVLADYHWYTFSEQINMPRILNEYKLDLVHFPHFNVPILYFRPFVVTVHDLILLNFPTTRGTTLGSLAYKLKFLAYKLVIGLGIRRAKRIITISEFTKNDILKNYRGAERKIAVTYEACDVDDSEKSGEEDSLQVLKKYGVISPECGIIKSYVLYVGNAYPHKNLERLVRCFRDVNQNNGDLRLVFVGKEDYFYRRLEQLVKKLGVRNVIFAGFVSDDDLKIVYENARLYVFPSLYEGFGLPPLEAMSRGVAVASSDHACMKEVLGDSAYFFNGKSEEEMAGAIIKLSESKDLRDVFVEKGNKRFRMYSWRKMAEETMKIFEDVLKL